ncbi:unnamed protein product [Effrenium voratum]|uniref:BTB domain-containing protein n=1 Tax=Effrenium voratum TaxID=2562239 RepID=A0AA36JJL2_9DINO|nr:unnamed protein product [Effrenium voratum]CAJ1425602.1 unnamed protein product [Effrenium voratum]
MLAWMRWWKGEGEQVDPQQQNCKHMTRVLRNFVEAGNLDRLTKFAPAKYDWAHSYNQREAPLLHAAIAAPFCRTNREGEIGDWKPHVAILQWMLRSGADPQRPAPSDCDGAVRIPGFDAVNYRNHSAISLAVELLTKVEDDLDDWDVRNWTFRDYLDAVVWCIETNWTGAMRPELGEYEPTPSSPSDQMQRCQHMTQALRAFIQHADLESLIKFTPAKYDWAYSYHKGQLPLLHIAVLAPFLETYVRSFNTQQKIVSWVLSFDVDPQRPAPAACEKLQFSTEYEYDVKIQVECSGTSAISMAIAVLTQFKDTVRAYPHEITPSIKLDVVPYLNTVLSLMARRLSKPSMVPVDTSLICRWKLMQDMSETHDATFETADGTVTCHSSILGAASTALRAMMTSKFKEFADKGIEVKSSKAAVVLFLDILYTGSARQEPDYKTVLDALNLSHCWDVQGAVQVLSETMRPD